MMPPLLFPIESKLVLERIAVGGGADAFGLQGLDQRRSGDPSLRFVEKKNVRAIVETLHIGACAWFGQARQLRQMVVEPANLGDARGIAVGKLAKLRASEGGGQRMHPQLRAQITGTENQ